MVEALLKNQKSVLNRVTIENIRVYYELSQSIFNLDSVNRPRKRNNQKDNKKKDGEETKGEESKGEDAKKESTEEKKTETSEEKKEEAPAAEEVEVSVWGTGPKLTGFKDLSDKHF